MCGVLLVIIEDLILKDRVSIFRGREHSGYILSNFLKERLDKKEDLVILAIPRGGVPVDCIVAKELRAEFDLIIVRKIPIPWNPEAGFGAVTPDGNFLLDESMVKYLGLKPNEVEKLVKRVLKEIRREQMLLGNRRKVDVVGKNVYFGG